MADQQRPIRRGRGITSSERVLQRLCEESFLSLWSYPSVYRNQHIRPGNREGKELCDLLVVFENHILIFSDKRCAFPASGNLDLDWSRWYRRAVQKSADQVWGAERWIRTHPDRLFLDRACVEPFPIDLPDVDRATFHRIVVAQGVSEPCRRELGGSGSLMLVPELKGVAHCLPRSEGGMPFAIGQVSPERGYVHVLDDTSLETVLHELDTIADFTSYLIKKERVLLDGRLGFAAGEDDLLGYYLGELNSKGEHDIVVPKNATHLLIDEGMWDRFKASPQRAARVEADSISYAWDTLIERFSGHLFAGTQHFAFPEYGPRSSERILRFLAREPRVRRRMLARALIDLIEQAPRHNHRSARVVPPARPGDPYLVFLVLSPPSTPIEYEQYRSVRRELLIDYCFAVKLRDPTALDIVGLAFDPITGEGGSEDAIYLDVRTFSDEDRRRAMIAREELGLLTQTRAFVGIEREYPDAPIVPPSRVTMKGRNRNSPCPCRSGRKFKTCCGRNASSTRT